ncbi:GH14922 [Drosophila grimshawi]|uniref:GH14922 n=1 Tax=Drosophila grimshawi TaxID=7222 RepID=B4J1Q9_DROGR|nr:GH14922 [Drosophila grimshawi]
MPYFRLHNKFANHVLSSSTLGPDSGLGLGSGPGHRHQRRQRHRRLASSALRINDFGVVREETVEEIAPGEFLVKGQLNQLYFPESGRLIVTYEAGPNGYVAKYSYIKEEGVMLPAVGLSADALKAAAG